MAESLDLEKMNIDAEALNCMAQGKRHLLVHDYSSAVLSLEEACKLYDSKYGISADECADAYLNYGHALLELHRQESGALDGLVEASPGDSEADDEEEAEDIEENLEEEGEESKNVDDSIATVSNGNNKTEVGEEDISVSPMPADQQSTKSSENENGTIATSSTMNGSNGGPSCSNDDKQEKQTMETDVDPNQPSTSTGITDDNREEDDTPSNIEVAFEVLTMAQEIYQRQTDYRDDAFLKLSDAKQKLGEIFIEWENFAAALEKFNESLEIRKRHLPDDDRLIAESFYHIGLTHSLDNKVTEANAVFQLAVDVIEQRISKLKSSYTTAAEESRKKIENEIKDLESVLPEMKSRIEDNQAEIATSKLASVVEEDEKLEEEMLAEKKKQIHAKPISNVSHLVKRKREEPNEADSNQVKKLKNGNENGSIEIENGSNGTTNVEMEEA